MHLTWVTVTLREQEKSAAGNIAGGGQCPNSVRQSDKKTVRPDDKPICLCLINQSNFYSANIPSVARLSGATARLVFKYKVVEAIP